MKKFYSFLLLLTLLTAGSAQCLAQSTSGKVYVGYAKYDDYLYEYDGIYLDHEAKVGCAILLTREMLAPYAGGTITQMRVGWGTHDRSGTYEAFVRPTFNGEDLSTGQGTVKYDYSSSTPGWNTLTMSQYEIPEDVEQLVAGFTTKIKKNEYAIPTLYPHGTPNSCYLWVDGDFDEAGNPRWVDMNEMGILAIQLVIKDAKGTFNYLPVIAHLTDNGIEETEKAGDVLMRLTNAGSQTISSIEVTSRQGEQTWSKQISASVGVGKTSRMFLAPIYCFHSGDVELSITKVNGKVIDNPTVRKVNLIGVPKAVSSQYTRRPLVEYYESENNYMSARYYDDFVESPIMKRSTKITFICQHLDDQFMTGDDDATTLCLQLCDGDSTKVSIPAMSIDRTMATENYLFQLPATDNPMFPVYTSEAESYALAAFDAAAKRPTFVALNVGGTLQDDQETIDINVGGDIAQGIMPEGEKPRLTVYLMERDVESDSQMFWTEKEKEQHRGNYTHANVIREILTAPEGDVVSEGEVKATYQTWIDPTWNPENLYLVAFVHRDGKLGNKRMQVFNTAKGNIDLADGIETVENGENEKMRNEIYDLCGRRVLRPTKGLYIKGNKKFATPNL